MKIEPRLTADELVRRAERRAKRQREWAFWILFITFFGVVTAALILGLRRGL